MNKQTIYTVVNTYTNGSDDAYDLTNGVTIYDHKDGTAYDRDNNEGYTAVMQGIGGPDEDGAHDAYEFIGWAKDSERAKY